MTRTMNHTRGCDATSLAQVGVGILNSHGYRLRCRKCGKLWYVFIGEGGTLPGHWWRCSTGCNATTPDDGPDAPEHLAQADCDAFNVEVVPGSGMRLRCNCCGSVWLVFRWSGSSMLPPGYWRCPRGCNEHGRARKPQRVTDEDLLHAVALREDEERTERAKVMRDG